MMRAPASRATRDFIASIAQSDVFAMMAAHAAMAQSTDHRVRAFAQAMIDGRSHAHDMLHQAATEAGMPPPPTGPGADQAPLLAALQGLRGADFDRAYWQHQGMALHAALVTTRIYADHGDDRAVCAIAAERAEASAAQIATVQVTIA